MNPTSTPDTITATTVLSRDRPWEPYRTLSTPEGNALVAECVAEVVALRRASGLPRPGLRADHQASVGAVVADLLHRHLTAGPDGWVAIPRGQDYLARSGDAVSPRNPALPKMLDALVTLGLAEQVRGQDRKATTLRATPTLTARAQAAGVDLGHLRRAEGGDAIILRGPKPTTQDGKIIRDAKGPLMRCPDNETTQSLRNEMARVNSYLSGADIRIEQGDDPTPELGPIDHDRRFLQRVFTQGALKFDRGGRLYGGFWQDMTRARRRACIRINGETTTTLDHSGMSVRMLYAKAGNPPPTQLDPYAVSPLLSWQRQGVKEVMNACISVSKPLVRFPQSDEPGGLKRHFGPAVKVGAVLSELERCHPTIWPMLFRGIVHELQTWESNYMVATLLRAVDQDIPALPIHDALIVPKSSEEIVMGIMTDTFRDHFGGAPCRVEPEH